MSRLKQTSGEDYPEASKKHCIDARVLLDNDRFDGAAYLAGYVAECIFKTLIQVEEKHSDPIKTHNLDNLSSNVLKLMALPNSRTVRYFKNGQISGITYGKPPDEWNECLRYFPGDTFKREKAKEWVHEAERLCVDVIGGLMKDGEV
jgi:HEPN domain-containing protein